MEAFIFHNKYHYANHIWSIMKFLKVVAIILVFILPTTLFCSQSSNTSCIWDTAIDEAHHAIHAYNTTNIQLLSNYQNLPEDLVKLNELKEEMIAKYQQCDAFDQVVLTGRFPDCAKELQNSKQLKK